MGLKKRLKKILHNRDEDDTPKKITPTGSDAKQQSSQLMNAGSSYVATIDSSGVSTLTSDGVVPPEEIYQEVTQKDLPAPKPNGNSIRQLWAVAYKSLQDEENSPVQNFEDQIRLNLPHIAEKMSSHENTKNWMNQVVQFQMDEIKRDTWKLRFGTFEMEAQEIVKSVLAVVNWSKDYVTKALSSNPTASIAWGGVTLLLPLFLNPIEQASSLAKGLEHIASVIVRSSMWENLYMRRYESATSDTLPESHAGYRRALEMLYQEILRFQIVCYSYYSHKSISRFALDTVNHHSWDELLGNIKYREKEFDQVSNSWRDKMYNEEWEKAETRHQQAMTQWRTIGTDVSELRKTVQDIQKDEKREKMLNWLCAVDTSVQYRAAREKYSSGTCNWLVQESEEFKNWEKSPESFLWLNGKAGSGKSILSSSVIKYLKDQYEDDPEIALAYYFFSFGNLEQQKMSVMLSSLVRQLCASRPDTPRPIKRFEDYMAKGERPDIETLEAALFAAVGGFSAVYIVVDALDECPVVDGERPKLLECLHRIICAMPDNLHVFCTSRAEPDIHMEIEELLDMPTKAAIDLTKTRAGLNKDLRLYIDTILGSKAYRWWSADVMAKAKDVLITRADGMFQYLVCQFEVLQQFDSEASILAALDDLPMGLDETYNRLLLGLNSKFKQQVLGSLKWLALSIRPLRLDELAEIFIFQPERVTKIHEKERLFDPQAVLKHFPSLVTTETKNEWIYGTMRKEYRTYVRLAHFTVKEYLISERIQQSKAKQFYFTEANAHLYIAHCCLSCHLCQTDDTTHHDKGMPLQDYAVRHWELHLKPVPRELWTSEIIRLIKLALSMRTKSLGEILCCGQFRSRWYAYPNQVDNLMQRPYCYTVAIGSLDLTQLLLQKRTRTRRFLMKEDLNLALREAAMEGHIEIVRFLVNERVNFSISTRGALQAAAYRGHLTVMKYLLDNGADIDEHNDIFGSALEAAANGMNLTEMRMLLDRGANVQVAGCPVSCLIAAYGELNGKDITGCTQVLKCLLDKGVGINRKCTKHGSALNAAIRVWSNNGTRTLFDFVVKRNADIELDDGLDGTPLQAACVKSGDLDRGHIDRGQRNEVVLALLRLGADPNTQGGEYGNALQKACCGSSLGCEAVDLLKNGAEVNLKGGFYGTALHAACAKSSLESVNLLLSRGADVHIHGGEYGSVLQAAASKHKRCYFRETAHMVQKLLNSGVSINTPGGKYGSALQAAAHAESPNSPRPDCESALEILLKSGAEVNMQGGIYGTALQSACVRGNMESVRLLLSHGAEVNIEGGRYGTAFQAACADEPRFGKPHHTMAHLLIDHGANVHVQGGYFGSAWHAAAAILHWEDQAHETLKLLLDNGVDVNHCDSQRGSALQVALEHLTSGIEARIQFLLEHGADINLGAGLYGFPLQSACAVPIDIFYGLEILGLTFILHNCVDINVNQTGGLFGTALQAAAYTGKTRGVKLLLEKGADANIRGGKYGSALNAAAVKGYWDIVEILLEAGAKADCFLFSEIDEEWLEGVEKEDGSSAVERYKKMWEVLTLEKNEVEEVETV